MPTHTGSMNFGEFMMPYSFETADKRAERKQKLDNRSMIGRKYSYSDIFATIPTNQPHMIPYSRHV